MPPGRIEIREQSSDTTNVYFFTPEEEKCADVYKDKETGGENEARILICFEDVDMFFWNHKMCWG